MRSLGVIAGLSVPCEEQVVSVDERALGYRQEYRRVDDDRPTTAIPVAGAVAAPADDADANTNAAPPPLPNIATAAAGVKRHLRLTTAWH